MCASLDFSVNRKKPDGQPEYALIPNWPNFGIAEFRMEQIPRPIASEGNKTYSWRLTHAPEEENYYHSEIHTFKDGVRCLKSTQVNDLVYREFRQRLSEKMRVTKSFQPRET